MLLGAGGVSQRRHGLFERTREEAEELGNVRWAMRGKRREELEGSGGGY